MFSSAKETINKLLFFSTHLIESGFSTLFCMCKQNIETDSAYSRRRS